MGDRADDWSENPSLWSLQEYYSSTQNCTLFIPPAVSICLKAYRGYLCLGLKTKERTPPPHRGGDSPSSSDTSGCDEDVGINTETKTTKILLDNVLVAQSRGTESLLYKKPLVRLESGRHHVQFIVSFDSGDVLMYHRVLVYNGPTARDYGSNEYVLESSGSGVLSPGKPLATWLLADGLLPCAVTLRSPPSSAPVTIRSSRAIVHSKDGEAVLTEFGGDRLFVVESNTFTEVPYDLCVGPLSSSPRLIPWNRPTGDEESGSGHKIALVVGTAQGVHVGTAQVGDSDAVAWVGILDEIGFESRLLGCARTSYAPHVPVGFATAANIKKCLGEYVVEVAGAGGSTTLLVAWTGGDLALSDDERLNTETLAGLVADIARAGVSVIVYADSCDVGAFARAMDGVSGRWYIAAADSGNDATVTPGAFTHALLTHGFMAADDADTASPLTTGALFEHTSHYYRYTRFGMAMITCAGDGTIRVC